MLESWTKFELFTLIYMLLFMAVDFYCGLFISVDVSLIVMMSGFVAYALITLSIAYIVDKYRSQSILTAVVLTLYFCRLNI